MKILYIWHWRWGDKDFCIYDLNKPDTRNHVRKVIREIREDTKSKDITRHEFHVLGSSMTMDEILQKIDEYPTHDPS